MKAVMRSPLRAREEERECQAPDCEVVLDPRNTSGFCKTCYQRDYMRRYRTKQGRIAREYEALGDPDEWECAVRGCEEGGEVWDSDTAWCRPHAQRRLERMREDILFLTHGLQ